MKTITTNDDILAEKAKMIANHGQKVKYEHEVIGINSRLDSLQAAVSNVKLAHLDSYSQKRQTAAAAYDEALKDIAHIEIPKRIAHSNHVFHQYTLKVKNGRRDELRNHLQENMKRKNKINIVGATMIKHQQWRNLSGLVRTPNTIKN